jgi:biotin carboxylase
VERTGPIFSRADEDDVRLAEDLILSPVVSSVKEILYHAGHIAEVFRRPDSQAAAGQKIIEETKKPLFQRLLEQHRTS